jgi:hypothetical protein
MPLTTTLRRTAGEQATLLSPLLAAGLREDPAAGRARDVPAKTETQSERTDKGGKTEAFDARAVPDDAPTRGDERCQSRPCPQTMG